ncbi:MAG: homocysteine S-methyltransferase family protein [Rhodospirillales bacterium]
MTYASVKARLDRGEGVLLDAATGTELEHRGVPMDSAAWCGPCNLNHADQVEAVHADYIAAGADIVTANTYAASRLMLEPAGLADRLPEIVTAACDAAKRARDISGRDVLIAGSMSHMVPIKPGTDVVDRDNQPSAETVRHAADEMAGLLAQNGVDLLILEMVYDRVRGPVLIEAACAAGLPVWCGFSLRRGNGKVGAAQSDAPIYGFGYLDDLPMETLFSWLPPSGVDAAGVMHSYPDVVGPGLEKLAEVFSGPLMAYPESGHFEMPHWNFAEVMPPADLAAYAKGWAGQGAQIIGGCCGLGGWPHPRPFRRQSRNFRGVGPAQTRRRRAMYAKGPQRGPRRGLSQPPGGR